MKVTVTADLLNVRAGPSRDNPVIGMVRGGAQVDVLSVQDGWAALAMSAGGAPVTLAGQPVVAYVSAEFLDLGQDGNSGGAPINNPVNPVVTPPAQAGTGYKLGLNTLTNGGLARQEAERGCRYFLCMNDFTGASQLKRAFPDAIVMVRRFFNHGALPSADQIINGLEGATDKNLIYTGLNEADQIGQDGDALRKRALLDIEVAQRIRQGSGATYAAGTFSMGCPDFTNPETCQIIREIYAPAYNAGLIAIDMHLYSPNPQHIDQPNEWQWFERRWEFLFTKCGFDPKVRAILCSETGLDQGGVGGFKAHNTSQEQFRDWCEKYIALQNAPLDVDGVKYPSPILGGAIFQLGGNADPKWDGYDVTNYLPTLRNFYNAVSRDVGKPKGLGETQKSKAGEKPSRKAEKKKGKKKKEKEKKEKNVKKAEKKAAQKTVNKR
jgi:hypothetical protein